MLSGNGRHRRPRQRPALLVAAGVTGSAITIPLLGATGASAASGTTWDAIADCESDRSWSADTDNGDYGGLQMTQETWENYGGLNYAPSPDQASRSQQTAVAEKVLADRGTSARATCGLVVGLAQDSASAHVTTGVAGDSTSSSTDSGSGLGGGGGLGSGSTSTDDSMESDTSDTPDAAESIDATQDSVGGSGATSPSPDSSPVGAAKGDDSDNFGQSNDFSIGLDVSVNAGATADAGAGTGRHRGGSAEEGAAASRADDFLGRHASRGGSALRDAADGSYVVRSGDSLWAIADSLGLEGGWPELYAENKETVGADPDLIFPGQSLELGTD